MLAFAHTVPAALLTTIRMVSKKTGFRLTIATLMDAAAEGAASFVQETIVASVGTPLSFVSSGSAVFRTGGEPVELHSAE